MKNTLLIGTRKGLLIFKNENGTWQLKSDHFVGARCPYAFQNENDGTFWALLDHGHWGAKVHRSQDGVKWDEIEAPKYPEGAMVKEGVEAKLEYPWMMTAGAKDQNGRLYMGTVPGGLFVSDDNGKSFELNESLWADPSRPDKWFGGGFDHPGIHSVLVNPDDNNHIILGISVAGVFESKDGGKTWYPRNKGLKADFLPDPNAEIGQDPHLVVAHPNDFNLLWQQNHCGIFRSIDGGANWTDISQEKGPAKFGFAIALDAEDKETAWVVPAVSDENRTAVNKALVVCRTSDGGKTWEEQRNGLPQKGVYDVTFRHALDISESTLAFGTTTGNLYLSDDKGENWQTIGNNLPPIYSVRFV